MKRFFEIFHLEFVSIMRSKTLLMLAVASVLWMFALPYLATGDGTADGARELEIHFSLGGVFALLVIALVSAATGAIARERAAKRLQLTLVRPVRYFILVLGKIAAYVATGAIVLALALAILLVRTDVRRPSRHVLSPVMESPREEARKMYASYLKDPSTPDEVRRASKSVVLRLLTQKAIDHYQPVPTNEVTKWTFALGDLAGTDSDFYVRLRLTNQFELRQDVLGSFELADLRGSVSNITQAVVTVPLGRGKVAADGQLGFFNRGKYNLMLRPRKDIQLLVAAGPFWTNALKAYAEMVAVLATIIAFGVFLGAGLGRPVALFTAIVTLAVAEMSPSVIEQYPDQLETDPLDRIGLLLTRGAAELTHPISSLAPAAALAKDECLESADVARLLVTDLFAVPLALALLSAIILPRKQDET